MRRKMSIIMILVMLVGLLPAGLTTKVAAADTASGKLDVVLLIDHSKTMGDETILTCISDHTHTTILGCYDNRMTAAKQTARDLVDEITDNNSQARIAVVSYDNSATEKCGFLHNKFLPKAAITLIGTSSKGANLDAGLEKAYNILQNDGRSDSRKAIILLSAGNVEYYNDPATGAISNDASNIVAEKLVGSDPVKYYSLDQAHLVRDLGVELYSIGVSTSGDARNLLIAAQDKGYYDLTSTNKKTAVVSSFATDLYAEDASFDTSSAGTKWSVGYYQQSIMPTSENLAELGFTGKLPALSKYYYDNSGNLRDTSGNISNPSDTDYHLGGYGTDKKAKGYLDETHTTATYLNDGTGRGGLLLVVVDAVGLSRSDVNCMRDTLAPLVYERNNDSDISNDIRDISIITNHNHSGLDTFGLWSFLNGLLLDDPVTGSNLNRPYVQFVGAAVVKAATQACSPQNIRTGSFYFAQTTASTITRNGRTVSYVEDTRYPDQYANDDTITYLRFHPDTNDPANSGKSTRDFYFIQIPIHLEALQGANRLASADFLAPMSKVLNEKMNADCLYLTGAEGGLSRTWCDFTIQDDYYQYFYNDYTSYAALSEAEKAAARSVNAAARNSNSAYRYYVETQVLGNIMGNQICGMNGTEARLLSKLNIASEKLEIELANDALAAFSNLKAISTRVYIKERSSGKLLPDSASETIRMQIVNASGGLNLTSIVTAITNLGISMHSVDDTMSAIDREAQEVENTLNASAEEGTSYEVTSLNDNDFNGISATGMYRIKCIKNFVSSFIKGQYGTYTTTEMHYLEFYTEQNNKVGMALIPGELCSELAYGGATRTTYTDAGGNQAKLSMDSSVYNLMYDGHNPDAANPATLVEIAAGSSADGSTQGTAKRNFSTFLKSGENISNAEYLSILNRTDKSVYKDTLIVIGQANDMIGYIIPPNDFWDPADVFFADRSMVINVVKITNDSTGNEVRTTLVSRSHYEESNSAGINTAWSVAKTFEKLMQKIN